MNDCKLREFDIMKTYTVVKVKFNHQGVICEHIDLGLKPMTEKEAVTFKSKMMKPGQYLVTHTRN